MITRFYGNSRRHGYNAIVRNTSKNELTEIGIELENFITHINKTEM